ncbi:FliJ protein [Fontimonas thermophila]|uniref:Flagellar FliJ protein n=1 Tax=Fontimonas thermophila TaxID=1076937 RepID=A0A1I2ISI0_9GAMM|nr:flagellar export protein FliJ [Fontimonas thermophila]SFF43766.1 FliJ protein [Fontimonas thermophila]
MTARPPSLSLQPLHRLAEAREQDAARRLLERQRELAERERRLRELVQYLAEYESAAQVHNAQMLMNRQAFLARLREAVAVQERLVEQARTNCDVERTHWLLQRREVSTLDQLIDRYRRRERDVEAQRAQRQLDEFALQRFVGENTSVSGGRGSE